MRFHSNDHKTRATRQTLLGSTLLVATSLTGFVGAAVAQASPPASSAHEPTANTVQEVIVTAEKRQVDLQKVPVTVIAITARDAASRGISGTEDLTASVPGLVINNTANVGSPYLRGIGSNLFDPSDEEAVALYIDGVYIANPESNLFNFNNIAQIEVLKGPQGTLFGRNAVGGVIQITTRDPSHTFSGNASVGYGNYGDFNASAYLTGPLATNLAGDVALLYENQSDGYGRDLTTGVKTFQQAIGNISVRSKLLFTPTDTTKITLSGNYSHLVNTDAYQQQNGKVSPLDGSSNPGPFNTNDDLNDRDTVNTGGGSAKFEQKLGGGGYRILDIVSYQETKVVYPLDDDITALPIADLLLKPRSHNYTEELQLSSPDQGRIKWIVGGFFYRSVGAWDPQSNNGKEQIDDSQTTTSYAGFGQATAELFRDTHLTLGGRYTTEHQVYQMYFPGDLHAEQTFNKFTYRASIDHQLTADILGYASINTGFKSGGYNLLDPGDSFKPETVRVEELGLKTEFFDHRLRFNIDGYYSNDSNVQVLSAITGGTVTNNAAAAVIKGIEADVEIVPTDGLSITGGLALQDGKYTSYPNAVSIVYSVNPVTGKSSAVRTTVNASGNQTVVTPPVSGDVTATYRINTSVGRIDPSVSVVYNGGFYWQADNTLSQPSYTLLNGSILWTLPNGKYSARLWAKNLTNAVYYISRQPVAGIGTPQQQAAPRTYGFTLSASF